MLVKVRQRNNFIWKVVSMKKESALQIYNFLLNLFLLKYSSYTIILTVTAGEVIKSATGLIMVLSESPSIEYQLSHSYSVEVIVTISDLRTYCKVQWIHNENHPIDLLTLVCNLTVS